MLANGEGELGGRAIAFRDRSSSAPESALGSAGSLPATRGPGPPPPPPVGDVERLAAPLPDARAGDDDEAPPYPRAVPRSPARFARGRRPAAGGYRTRAELTRDVSRHRASPGAAAPRPRHASAAVQREPSHDRANVSYALTVRSVDDRRLLELRSSDRRSVKSSQPGGQIPWVLGFLITAPIEAGRRTFRLPIRGLSASGTRSLPRPPPLLS